MPLSLTRGYDPRDPGNAELNDHRWFVWAARALWGGALLMVVAAGAIGWLGLQDAARDRDVLAFFAALRAGDDQAIEARTTPDATLDWDFLRQAVGPNTDFVEESSVFVGTGTACVRGRLAPGQAQLILSLVELEGEWMVRRAGNVDVECEAILDEP